MPADPKISHVVEQRYVATAPTAEYARTYPDMPDRLRGVVDWLDKNLRSAGFAFMLDRVDARVVQIRDAWARKYALTPAEVRLTAYLVNGGTIASYAKAHGLSRNTARNQLQSAYCKTGTHRQAELVSLLLKA
jgi:DNA-binding CsgD family transcriptional regulator